MLTPFSSLIFVKKIENKSFALIIKFCKPLEIFKEASIVIVQQQDFFLIC